MGKAPGDCRGRQGSLCCSLREPMAANAPSDRDRVLLGSAGRTWLGQLDLGWDMQVRLTEARRTIPPPRDTPCRKRPRGEQPSQPVPPAPELPEGGAALAGQSRPQTPPAVTTTCQSACFLLRSSCLPFVLCVLTVAVTQLDTAY